jgi:hypothetical protein
MAALASTALPRISKCGRSRPGARSAANCSSASIRSPARTGAGVVVIRAARTTVTTAASCFTRTSDASSRPPRPPRPKARWPCRGAFAGADGAVQVAGRVSGSARAGPAPAHPSCGSRRQPYRRAIRAAPRRAGAPRPGTKQLMRRSLADLVPNPSRVSCAGPACIFNTAGAPGAHGSKDDCIGDGIKRHGPVAPHGRVAASWSAARR